MHPILAERKRLGLYLAAWLPVAFLLAVLVALAGRAPWSEALALALPLSAVYAFQCLPSWYLCRSFPLQPNGLLNAAAVLGLAAATSAGLWLLVGGQWAAILSQNPAFAGAEVLFRSSYPLLFAAGAALFLMAAAASYLLIAAEKSREAEQQTLQLKVLAKEAELRALKAQLDPHFLFNSLNSVMALIGSDTREAQRLCLLLSDFLRKSLNTSSVEVIPLEEELSLLKGYLDIERIRFGSRLSAKIAIDDDCRACQVPPLLLQPLVENAINHGIAQLVAGGEISIIAGRRGQELLISVSNPFDPDSRRSRQGGIGLANVRSRLKMLYGNESRLDIMKDGGVFRVEIRMPAVSKESAPPALKTGAARTRDDKPPAP